MIVDVQIDATMPELADRDMASVVSRISEIMLDSIRRKQFGAGGSPERWAPLAKGGASYLFKTGALLQSLEATTGMDPDAFWAKVSTTGGLPYAGIHQFGGYAGKNLSAYIPARPYMVLTDEDVDLITKEAVGMIVEILNATPTKGVSKANEF